MKREARLLSDRAINSILLSIEHFNRPSDDGRVEAVLIFLDHSFEMLLKAAIIERDGKIREKGAPQTIGFDKCVRIALTKGDVKFLNEDQALTLQALNGLRDAAQHHLVDVSEGQLYVVAQASVTLFRDVLADVFGIQLSERMPERVLPISTSPPRDLTALFDADIQEVRSLLAPNSRQAIAAKAKLRGLAIMEGAVHGKNTQPSPNELDRLAKEIRNGKAWPDMFPGVASLALSAEGEGSLIKLRITKKEGVPIRVIREGEEAQGVVAIRRINELDFYTLTLQNLSTHVGLGRNKLLKVIEELKIQDDEELFKEVIVGKVRSKLYSEKAITKLKDELPKLDIEEIWNRRRKR